MNTSIDPLFVELYPRLHRLAHALLRKERVGHTLETSALVHDAFTALRRQDAYGDLEPAHFFAVAAACMRHALVDHARRHDALRRGGGRPRVPFTELSDDGQLDEATVLDVHAILEEMRAGGPVSERHARMLDLRVFAGLDFPTIASLMGCSLRQVFKDWAAARAYLNVRLRHE